MEILLDTTINNYLTTHQKEATMPKLQTWFYNWMLKNKMLPSTTKMTPDNIKVTVTSLPYKGFEIITQKNVHFYVGCIGYMGGDREKRSGNNVLYSLCNKAFLDHLQNEPQHVIIAHRPFDNNKESATPYQLLAVRCFKTFGAHIDTQLPKYRAEKPFSSLFDLQTAIDFMNTRIKSTKKNDNDPLIETVFTDKMFIIGWNTDTLSNNLSQLALITLTAKKLAAAENIELVLDADSVEFSKENNESAVNYLLSLVY